MRAALAITAAAFREASWAELADDAGALLGLIVILACLFIALGVLA